MNNNNSELFQYGDEQFRAIELANNQVLILSALDELSIGKSTDIGDDYSAKDCVKIFAESLLLAESFKSQNCQISAFSITTVEGLIDTSGKDGKTPQLPLPVSGEGAAGEDGKNAGQISLYLENMPTANFPLHLHAMGGNGGDGQTGPQCKVGGNGGNGGNGGKVDICGNSPYKILRLSLYDAYKANSTALDKLTAMQSVAQINDMGIRDAVEESIKVLYSELGLEFKSTTLDQEINNLKSKISSMSKEDKTNALKKVNEALQSVVESLLTQDVFWEASLIPTYTNVSGGHRGVFGIGEVKGKSGTDGLPGKTTLSACSKVSEIVEQKIFPCLHPDQLTMMLQKAKMLYFTADVVTNPGNFKDAATILNRLINRTERFLKDDDLSNYYREHEAELATMNSIDTFRSVHSEANALLNQLKNGQDYYGYKDNDVPLASFSFYKDLIDKQLSILEKIESSYDNYFQNLKDTTKAVNSLKDARNLAGNVIEQANIKIKLLSSQAEEVATEIDFFQNKIATKKESVLGKITKVREEIESASGYNVEDLISALSMCAFAPESSLLIASQGFDYLYKSNYTIDTSDGMHVRKDYVVSRLKACETDFKSLKEGYQELSDGTLACDDPGANKLIVEKQNLEQFLDQFYSKFPDDIKDVQDEFQSYIDLILQRNNYILSYNAMVTLMVSLNNTIESNKEKINQLNDQVLETVQPDLPALTTYMSKLFSDARAQVMYELYLTARAYRYWALSDENLIATTFGSNPPSKIVSSMLRAAQSTILSHYSSAIEERGKLAQSFPASPEERGIIYRFPADNLDDFLQQLKEENEIYFTIPTVLPETTKEENEFAGLANVRVLKVRPWIKGAKTKDMELQVDIIQCGTEEIVNSSGMVYSFNHKPVQTKFIYNVTTNCITEDGDVGEKDEQATYALIGPFACWRLMVRKDWNKELDLSEITDIEIEFWGTNYSFDE